MTADKIGFSEAEIDAALAECEREPVHTPGSVQHFGVVLCFDLALSRVLRVSATVAECLGITAQQCLVSSAEELLGKSLTGKIRRGLSQSDRMPGALTATRNFSGKSQRLHVAAYRSGSVRGTMECIVVELEPLDGGTRYRWLSLVSDGLSKLVVTRSQEQVTEVLAQTVRSITDFDRVVVYVFDPDWNGQVVAQSGNDRLPSLLHHHFPASDIPPQVRALYALNRTRFIADCGAKPIALVAAADNAAQSPVDLSGGTLRGVSPVHCEYMRNMGTRSSLSIAIFSDSGLWGLVSCHNSTPLVLSPSARDSATTLVQVASQRLFLLKAESESAYRLRIHENRVMLARSVQERVAPGDLLVQYADNWCELFDAQGVAMVYLGEVTTAGVVPGEDFLRRLGNWLESRVAEAEPWATQALADAGFPQARNVEGCCGLLAMPLLIDMDARGWLIFFRPEQVRHIQWAGKPEKQLYQQNDQWRMSPRKSFDAWQEEVRGTSQPWLEAEMMAVRDLGDDLAVIASAHEITRLNEYLRRERRALAEANEHLNELANTDSLTGIMNRYRIEHLVQMALANAERYSQPFSVLLFDIDHFKQVNDTHGHEEGDRILKTLVAAIQEGLREADQLGRWGGEEFLVLVPNTRLEDAGVFAERLRDRVARTPFGLEMPVTISIGVAEWAPGDSQRNLLARADRSMYRAKHLGRNRVCLQEPHE